jgi:hypothetical protein
MAALFSHEAIGFAILWLVRSQRNTTETRLDEAQRRGADRLEAGEMPIRKLAHYISAESTMVAKQQRNPSCHRLLYIKIHLYDQ